MTTTRLNGSLGPFGARNLAGFLALAGFGALAVALTAEFGFGIEPCPLCRYQQIAHGTAAGIALGGLVLPLGPRARTGLMAICALVFLVGGAIAFFHVGVEQHWWGAPAVCGGGLAHANGISLDDLRAALAEPAVKPCDIVDWTLFGVSMATYNTIFSLALALAAGGVVRREIARSTA